MSKMAYLKATRGAAGGLPILGAIAGLLPKVAKIGGKLLGIGKKVVANPAAKDLAKVAAGGAGYAAAAKLMGSGGGASGSWAPAEKVAASRPRSFAALTKSRVFSIASEWFRAKRADIKSADRRKAWRT